MLRGQNMAFGVRHQAEDMAGDIAQPGQVFLRSIGVDGKAAGLPRSIDIVQNDLARLIEPFEDPFQPAREFAFAVGHGQLEAIVSLEERALARGGPSG